MPSELDPADRVEVTVLVDNQTDSLSSVPQNISQEFDNLEGGKLKELSGCCLCCAQHGLSLLVESYRGEAKTTLLFDAGPEAYALDRNIQRLAMDLKDTEGVVLSHGHWDHGGGLEKAFELIGKSGVPLYINEGMFVRRAVESGSEIFPLANIPTLERMEKAGAKGVMTGKDPLFIEGGFYLSGEIPRKVSYEKGFIGHVCWSEEGQRWMPDPWIMDERYLAVNIKNRGLFVFTACSHAGVINVLTDVSEKFQGIPLYGVMGGFHLAGKAMEDRIDSTVEDFAQFDLDLIVPGHCTGWRATAKLYQKYGDERVVPSAVGRRYTLC